MSKRTAAGQSLLAHIELLHERVESPSSSDVAAFYGWVADIEAQAAPPASEALLIQAASHVIQAWHYRQEKPEWIGDLHKAISELDAALAATPAPPALDPNTLVRALRTLHGDNVPLYARGVITTPEDYAAKIIEVARLVARLSASKEQG